MSVRERGDGRGRREEEQKVVPYYFYFNYANTQHSIYTTTDLNHTHTDTLNTPIDLPFYMDLVCL